MSQNDSAIVNNKKYNLFFLMSPNAIDDIKVALYILSVISCILFHRVCKTFYIAHYIKSVSLAKISQSHDWKTANAVLRLIAIKRISLLYFSSISSYKLVIIAKLE